MRRFDARTLCAFACALAFTFSFVPRARAAEDSSGPRRLVVEKVDESRLVTLKTAVPGAVKRSTDEGSVAADRKMKLQLVLKRTPEQQQALEAFVKETQTPGNGNFGKTISPEVFTETFGLAKSDVEAVTNWLESHGFEVKGTDGGTLRLSFTGSAAEVEEAFHTEIHNYKTPDGEIRFANIGDLRIPAALEPVVGGVAGLQDFVRVRIVGYDGPVARPGTEPRGEEAAPVKELNPEWRSPISGGSQLAKAREGEGTAGRNECDDDDGGVGAGDGCICERHVRSSDDDGGVVGFFADADRDGGIVGQLGDIQRADQHQFLHAGDGAVRLHIHLDDGERGGKPGDGCSDGELFRRCELRDLDGQQDAGPHLHERGQPGFGLEFHTLVLHVGGRYGKEHQLHD